MRYFIVGYPKMYNMLHGICDYKIEDTTYTEACELGKKLSRETIEIFCHPNEEWFSRENYREDNNITEWNSEYELDYQKQLEKIIEDEVAYKVWQVKNETSSEAIRLWANSNDDVNDFVERYCVK